MGDTIVYGPGFDVAGPGRTGGAGRASRPARGAAPREPAGGLAERLGPRFDASLYGLAADGIINETLLLAGHGLPRPAVTLTDLLEEIGRPAKSPVDGAGRLGRRPAGHAAPFRRAPGREGPRLGRDPRLRAGPEPGGARRHRRAAEDGGLAQPASPRAGGGAQGRHGHRAAGRDPGRHGPGGDRMGGRVARYTGPRADRPAPRVAPQSRPVPGSP
jgi:hypothetical protein